MIKFPVTKYPVAKYPVTKYPVTKYPVTNMAAPLPHLNVLCGGVYKSFGVQYKKIQILFILHSPVQSVHTDFLYYPDNPYIIRAHFLPPKYFDQQIFDPNVFQTVVIDRETLCVQK